jgi:hypothetical protein
MKFLLQARIPDSSEKSELAGNARQAGQGSHTRKYASRACRAVLRYELLLARQESSGELEPANAG